MLPSARLLLLLLLVGCPSAPSDPGVIVIPDDDDSASTDDDDAGDDDTADDDDTSPGGLRALVLLSEINEIESGGAVIATSIQAFASFSDGEALPWGDPTGLDNRPLPGVSLHPEAILATPEPGCVAFNSAGGLDPLPPTDPVGGLVTLRPTTAGASLELLPVGSLYVFSGAEPLVSSSYSVEVKGGAVWPPATLPNALVLRAGPTGLLPGPGALGNPSAVEFRWDELGEPTGVEILLVRWTTVNQTAWTAVRCRADDDGSFVVSGATLAAGNGDIEVSVSRGAFTTDGLSAGGGAIQAHLGAIRVTRYRLSLG